MSASVSTFSSSLSQLFCSCAFCCSVGRLRLTPSTTQCPPLPGLHSGARREHELLVAVGLSLGHSGVGNPGPVGMGSLRDGFTQAWAKAWRDPGPQPFQLWRPHREWPRKTGLELRKRGARQSPEKSLQAPTRRQPPGSLQLLELANSPCCFYSLHPCSLATAGPAALLLCQSWASLAQLCHLCCFFLCVTNSAHTTENKKINKYIKI